MGHFASSTRTVDTQVEEGPWRMQRADWRIRRKHCIQKEVECQQCLGCAIPWRNQGAYG